jgi:hypothetical protein
MRQVAFAVVAIAGLAASAQAQTLRLHTNVFSNNPGGEFTITPLTGFAGLTGLAGDLAANTFETFCVERSENFQSGQTFDFAINTGAVNGGHGGQTSPNFDPISPETAFLYTNFRLGTLVGFDYGAGRKASADALQDAIWFLEDEGGANNAFVALAKAAVTNGLWVGIGDVRVLNLTQGTSRRQDQLTIIPAPATGLVLLGLAFTRRRRA